MAKNDPAIKILLKKLGTAIKEKQFSEADSLINKILEMDSTNVYARAYKERLVFMMKQQNVPHQKNEAVQTSEPIVEKEILHEQSRITSASGEAFKTLLMEVWKDGIITQEESAFIQSMQETFNITPKEYVQIDRAVRLQTLLGLYKIEFKKGNQNTAQLFLQFQVSQQEYRWFEGKVNEVQKALQSTASILVLDDDKNFLLWAKTLLEKYNYHCYITSSAEEGLEYIKTNIPDILLCDIAFGQNKMSGFAFFEKFREIPQFTKTPFIFISAINKESFITSSKKLGVDDYLTKPVDAELLLASIHGKLRRSRELLSTEINSEL